MIIVFVMDSYGLQSNGTSATAKRFADSLRAKGHTVRIVGTKCEALKDDPDYFGVDPYHLPVFQWVVDKQGFLFAKSTVETIYRAIKGADVVHLFLPFALEEKARLIAQSLNVPVTAAFHLQPENITYTIYLGKNYFVNALLYKIFYESFYKYIRHIHCPSLMIANQLAKHHYTNNVTHVISNGVDPLFKKRPSEKPDKFKDKFIILMIGRLSREKRQDLIIKAIGRSKFNGKIQLILCGQGPTESHIRELGKKYLANKIDIKFVKQDELINIINYSDLYVHSSDAEIEAIACIEAFSCGLVPVISDSKYSATNQFALDQHCLFKAGSSRSLSRQIDYFIQNPDAITELSAMYIEYSQQYRLEYQVAKLEKVFQMAIDEKKAGTDLPSVIMSKKDKIKIGKIEKILARKMGHKYYENEFIEKTEDSDDQQR